MKLLKSLGVNSHINWTFARTLNSDRNGEFHSENTGQFMKSTRAQWISNPEDHIPLREQIKVGANVWTQANNREPREASVQSNQGLEHI